MSHVRAIEVQIKDLDSLKEAVTELGLTFIEGKTKFAWYGRWVNDYHGEDAAFKHGIATEDYGKCEHVIGVPGCGYEIGVLKHPSGDGFTLTYDFWGPGKAIETAVGKGCEKIKSAYAEKVVEKQLDKLKAKGFHHHNTVKANGKTVISFRRTGNG
jgi:hypothetical protein